MSPSGCQGGHQLDKPDEIAHSSDHERSNRSIMNTESGDHEHAPAVS